MSKHQFKIQAKHLSQEVCLVESTTPEVAHKQVKEQSNQNFRVLNIFYDFILFKHEAREISSVYDRPSFSFLLCFSGRIQNTT